MRSRPGLVLVRAGACSLHPAWLRGNEAPNFDLVLCPCQDIPLDPSAFMQTRTLPGQKWNGIHTLLTEWDGWRQYDYIWLPDDDLLTDSRTINRLFELSARFDTTLSTPALSEDSCFAHAVSMRNLNFYARASGFVDLALPCLRRDVLELVLPSIGFAKSGHGWGLDFVWPRMINYQNIMIFDCITVRRAFFNRAFAQQDDTEMSRLLAASGAPMQFKIIGATAEDGSVERADSRLFLLKYLNGYRYLIARHPSLIDDLLRQQAVVLPPPSLPDLPLGHAAG